MISLEDASRLGDITAFEDECRQSTMLDQLKSLLDTIVRQFGFRWFALVHNVDLKRTTRKALLITTYPARWVEEVIDARLHLDDPVHVACAKTVSGLTWDQIGDYIAPNARQLSILRSEEHTSELQSLMRISYAVFCLNKNKHKK